MNDNDEALREAVRIAIDKAWEGGYQAAADALCALADGVNNPTTQGSLLAAAEILIKMKPNFDRNHTVKTIIAELKHTNMNPKQ